MKLKRCPNLHYYDGDKYDRCPHCADQPEPAPAPKPVFEPLPQPESQQETAPQKAEKPPVIQPEPPEVQPPKPQPPEPQPEPVKINTPPSPAPVTKQEPAFVPQNDEVWRCKCGAVNNGRFCFECGSPKPVPEPSSWKCACGAENIGKFCNQCGKPKPDADTAPAEPQPPAVPKQEDDRSLTAMLQEAKFTGTMDDARKKASSSDDEGVTQVVFDEIDDGFVLAWLTVTNSSSKGKVFTLTNAKNTIGRADPEHPVDINLHNDRGISRGVQATIVYDPLNKKFFLQSAGGKTFVYVNQEILLTYNELKPYDIIRVGETNLVFVPLCNEKFSW